MIQYIEGDLFSHSSGKFTLLAHACNPFGLWGGGIAAQFKKRYPSAFKLYASHCHQHGSSLLGNSLIVPTEESDPGFGGGKVYIACLFTSNFENTPDEIVEYTRLSMQELGEQLKQLDDIELESGKPVVNMPMINSGIFNVPWKETEKVLQNTDFRINVYTL